METLREQGRDSIRDSDVKRKMLELDSSFDEAELGFGKFSRFLRQAHDHEVIDLQKQEGGNYEVSLGGAAPREGSAKVGTPAEARRPRARSESAPIELASPAPSVQKAVSLPAGSSAAVSPAATPGLGPRRGSTRRRHAEGPPPLLEGQALPAGREEPGGLAPELTTGPVNPELLGLPTDADAQIRYLTNYRGVGRKTAEALVEGFGNELYTVLQHEPHRLGNVVPTGRAEQVLEAWRADYERRLGGDSAPAEVPQARDMPPDVPGEGPEGPGQVAHRSGGPRRRTRRGGRRGGGQGRGG